jgi:predicted DNA-binding ribbon-helix-helix protein
MRSAKTIRGLVGCSQPENREPKPHAIIKRSIVVGGHKTSISLEDGFWHQLKDIAHARRSNLSKLVAEIDQTRTGNLSSAIRVFILEHLRDRER